MQETGRKEKDHYAQALECSGLRNKNQQGSRHLQKRKRFAQVCQAEERRKPRSKPQRHWIDMHGWVREDQTTINPSNAQALDTCKGQIDAQAQNHKNPNLDARGEQCIEPTRE